MKILGRVFGIGFLLTCFLCMVGWFFASRTPVPNTYMKYRLFPSVKVVKHPTREDRDFFYYMVRDYHFPKDTSEYQHTQKLLTPHISFDTTYEVQYKCFFGWKSLSFYDEFHAPRKNTFSVGQYFIGKICERGGLNLWKRANDSLDRYRDSLDNPDKYLVNLPIPTPKEFNCRGK